MDLTQQQIYDLRDYRFKIKLKISLLNQMDRKLANDRRSWKRGDTLRRERMLGPDQETEWEIPCGLQRQESLMAQIQHQENAKTEM